MKKIKEIARPSFRLVRNLEHYNYHKQVLNAVTPFLAKSYHMEDQRLAYERLFKKEDEAIGRDRAFGETKDIQAADHKREELFLFIKRFIENMRYNPDTALKSAGQSLGEALDPYRNASRKSFQENTQLMDAFVKRIEDEPILFQAMELLDLVRPLEMLKSANDHCRELYNERSVKRQERGLKDKLKELRPQVDQAFFELIKFINAVYLVSLEVTKEQAVVEELEQVIDAVNDFTTQMLDGIAERRARKAAEE
jgi:hypothetical protein